jgi:hypothetical protein
VRAKYLRLANQDVAAFNLRLAVHVSLAELYEVIDESSGKTLPLVFLASPDDLKVDEKAFVQRNSEERSGKLDFKVGGNLVDRSQLFESVVGEVEHVILLVELPK